MRNIAIIPARSGSKGLPDKNIKALCGKPMLAYSVEAAIESGCFDEIHVSTDSQRYADIARQWGASVPFLRSEEASSDTASSYQMIVEVLERYAQQGKEFDTFTLLQPTSPLRTSKDIRNAYALYEEKRAKSVVAICKMEHSPLWSNVLPDDLSLDSFIRPEAVNHGRQRFREYYRINGAIYISDAKNYVRMETFYGADSYAYVMPKERSVDIDDRMDFLIAETLIKNGVSGENR